MSRLIRIGSLVAVTLLLTVVGASADDCFTYLPPPMLDTSDNTNQAPITDRAMQANIIHRSGTPYLVLNTGNDLKLLRLTDPTDPSSAASSSWMFSVVQPDGDVDFNLFGIAMCDDCRYGMANYRNSGAIVFDTGAGTTPSFAGGSQAYLDHTSLGSFTFKKGATQYLVSNGLESNAPATLYEIDGVDADDITEIMRFDAASGAYQVRMGERYGNHLYLAAASSAMPVRGQVVIADITAPTNPTVVAFGAAVGAAYSPLSVDAANGYMVTAGFEGVELYDIAGDPMAPALLASISPPAGQQITTVTVSYPYLVLQNQGGLWMDVYDITVPTQPTPISSSYWTDRDLVHNDYGGGAVPYDAAFSPGADVVYLARHVVAQAFEIDCVSVAPVANVSVTPDPAYPGDQITAVSTSSGPVSSTWMWVTDATGTVVAGDQPFGPQRESLTWTVPDDLLSSDQLTVHVAVAGDGYPYNAAVPGDQLKERAIAIDRAPQVEITTAPDAVITGDTVTLTADAEGHPSSGSEDSPYTWTIAPPSDKAYSDTGEQVAVELTESGQWCWGVDVQYQHEATGGGLFIAENDGCLTVSSVAAAFTVSPSQPLEGDEITLDASGSVVQLGVFPEYAWTFLNGPTLYTGCPGEETCVIPADTLVSSESGSPYEVQLQITNPTNGDTDTTTRTFPVIDDDISADFTFSPPSPEIGTSVLFTATGITGEIEQITWYYGGSGCSGYSSPATCTPSAFTDCREITYKYASGGNKSVYYVVTVGGAEYTSARHTVTVASSGSCNDCSYQLSPSSASYGSAQANGSFSVQTSSGCTWSASSNRSWIQITSGGSGSGTGSVSYRVLQNTTTSSRSGTITVQGKSFQISQSAGSASSVNFTISDSTPEIGQEVTFTIDSEPNTWDKIKWNFGGSSCDGETPVVDCGVFNDGCYSMTWRYSTSGTKTVTLTVNEGMATSATRARSVTVSSTGSCVECELSAPPQASFVLSPDEVAIDMPVTFTDTSTGEPADAWSWRITRDGSTVHTASSRSFAYSFAQPGLYQIALTASNCAGEDTATQMLEVFESLGPEEFVVPAVVHATGQNDTSWKTDLRVFNPCDAGLDVRIDFLELGIDNSGPSPPGISRALVPHQTLVLDDVLMWIPFHEENTQGSLRVTFEGPSACTPVVMSRTYNDTPDGTYGQYVPAVAVAEGDGENLMLTGLAHNTLYRTNVGLANLSGIGVPGITLRILDPAGNVLAEKSDVGLPPYSSIQVVNVARAAGVSDDLDLFSLEIDANGEYITAYASLIDNRTDDPVMYTPIRSTNPTVFLPGTAHVAGVGESLWRSDLTLFNPTDSTMTVELAYHPEDQQGAQKGWELTPKASLFLPDVVGLFRPMDDSKGYFTVSVADPASAQTLAPGFSWTPTSPSVGDSVIFSLSGVTAEIASVQWSFDDPGCGSQDTTCVANVWDDCTQKTFRFANAGDHSVRYTVEYVSGSQQTSTTQIVTVDSDGECPGGTCSYSISPGSRNFDQGGGAGSISLTTSSGCSWTASSNKSWIRITSGTSGNGSSTVSYTVDANASSSSRNGTVTVGGRSHSVYQSGAGADCTYSVSPSQRTVAGSGGSGTFSVTADSGCGWSASPTQGWIQITSGASGSGSGSVTFSAPANPTQYSRTGGIAIAGQTVYVIQEAPASESTLMPLLAARTYSLSPTGTFGQNTPAIASSEALSAGSPAYIPGVVASNPQETTGFRTNLGLINTGTADARVDITFYADSGGAPIGFIPSYPLGGKQSVQFNIHQALGMQAQTTGSLKLEVVSGGPVVAYASVVDNRTQDPTFVPALKLR